MGSESVPVSIRKSADPRKAQSIVISLEDAVSSEGIHVRVREAERRYLDTIALCRELVSKMQRSRSDPMLRWRLAETIEGFRAQMEEAWGLIPTNLSTALSRDLRISESAVGYILRLRRRFSRDEVERSGIGWSKFQEILDIKDDVEMKRCFHMVSKGELRWDAEIRNFKRRVNAAR